MYGVVGTQRGVSVLFHTCKPIPMIAPKPKVDIDDECERQKGNKMVCHTTIVLFVDVDLFCYLLFQIKTVSISPSGTQYSIIDCLLCPVTHPCHTPIDRICFVEFSTLIYSNRITVFCVFGSATDRLWREYQLSEMLADRVQITNY